MKHLNINAPIIPQEGLGGFKLKNHISDYVEDIKSFTDLDNQLIDRSVGIVDKFYIKYRIHKEIMLGFNIIEGCLSLIVALEDYKGKLFNSIHIGMSIEEALSLEPRLYYDEVEEAYFINGEGIAIFLEDPYTDHIANPTNKIIEISVFIPEMLILP